MKIKLTIYPGGGIDCNSNDCRYKKDCANHVTAGDYRSEGGISPHLKITSIFLGGADANCSTADKSIYTVHDYNPGGAKYFKIKNGEIKGYRKYESY